jgi:ACS family hexuronate transporter-like MFS transporter
VWLALWLLFYHSPERHPWLHPKELEYIRKDTVEDKKVVVPPAWLDLLKDRKVQGIILARFLGDPVWWLYLVWLPLYLYSARGFSLKSIGIFAWIPYVFADAGALLGGWFSGRLIHRGWSPKRARGLAIFLPALLTPAGMLVGGASSSAEVIALISVVLFAFQFWINNLQTLTSDFFPNDLVASVSGMAGTAAGLGAMLFMLTTGLVIERFGYTPILIISGLLIPIATIVLGLLCRDVHTGNEK